MAITVGGPGFDMSMEDRIAALVASVGGPTKAAALIGRTRTHIDNMRKPDAVLRLADLLPLCIEAGVSLDWVATGYQHRPDLVAGTGAAPADGFVALKSLAGGQAEICVASSLLSAFGLDIETAAVAAAGDDGMRPQVYKGALALVDLRQGRLRSGVYAVTIGDEVLIRRLNRRPDGSVELVADGEPTWRYPLSAADQDALPLHRVVWVGQPI